MSPSREFWLGRRVFVTGHTGFKGAWLSLWLQSLGAEVHGFGLEPPTMPSLYEVAGVGRGMASDVRADVRDAAALSDSMRAAAPAVVLHLAAQSLVTTSYAQPVETYAVNVMGSVHLLEALRRVAGVRAVVMVTTDKCYENREWIHPYRESDRLGGRDPYSNSKACAELVTDAYRRSFLSGETSCAVASARAGNVIGGGDWADNRLLPDCIRTFTAGEPVLLRHPNAVRPWQHVLEPLAGYLRLAECLSGEYGSRYAEAWNFAPDPGDDAPVGVVAAKVAILWGGSARVAHEAVCDRPHEARLLRLDATKAQIVLGWRPRWRLDHALEETVAWYRRWSKGEDMRLASLSQIASYDRDAEGALLSS